MFKGVVCRLVTDSPKLILTGQSPLQLRGYATAPHDVPLLSLSGELNSVYILTKDTC